jgi:hypothetical protein
MDTPQTRTLHRALDVLGSKSRLAAALRVSLSELDAYLTGEHRLPDDVYMGALDIVAHSPRDQ